MDLSRLGSVVRTRWGAATDQGPRPDNEDHWAAQPPLYAVADGMGGHAGGGRASEVAIQAFTGALSGDALNGREADVNDLDHAISVAAQAVMALATPSSMSDEDKDLANIVLAGAPGTTLTGVLIASHEERPQWLVFNVGDSRTYLINDGQIRAMTKDHSARQEARDAQWSPDELPAANIITRALGGGMPGPPQADFTVTTIAPGDRVVICSDGVHSAIDDAEMVRIVTQSDDAQRAANALVDAALERQTRDNATVVTIFVESVNPPWPADDSVNPFERTVGIARPSSTQTIRRQPGSDAAEQAGDEVPSSAEETI